jgi:hypothetical protein
MRRLGNFNFQLPKYLEKLGNINSSQDLVFSSVVPASLQRKDNLDSSYKHFIEIW